MDISEALRNEDLSKADFFDFVTCPELSDSGRLIRGSPQGANGFVDSLQELKETNNNHLPSTDGFEQLLWNSAGQPVNGDLVKTEPVKLTPYEDWNKLWGHAVVTTEPVGSTSVPRNNNNNNNNNTDGAIYTLTVLNGETNNQNWFSPKPEDQIPQQEIESLLNIMAPTNGFRADALDLVNSPSAATTFNYADEPPPPPPTAMPCTNSTSSNTSTTTTSSDPLLNESDESIHNSLLRSALQGKASFLSTRYNISIEQSCDDVSTEMGHTNGVGGGGASELVVPSPIDSSRADSSPGGSQHLFAATGVLPSMFDHQNLDSEPSSMDELLLSQLDATYDYEKLRRIEDEVAESVQQYCSHAPDDSIFKLAAENGVLQPTNQAVATPPAKVKKYSKRSKASAADKANNAANAINNGGVRKERSLHYCTICSKGFKDKYSVNVHIRTHTGEKPFACTICGKSFRQKAHLAKHYQTHTQKTLSNSPNHKSSKR
ncbi:protein sister of odd and bowel [Cloeon dipterum]|uniref:protein sister of odd and bowel n=1 Tax=Cloeon dipterum TaxID=197152 RepID=UPI0032201D2F